MCSSSFLPRTKIFPPRLSSKPCKTAFITKLVNTWPNGPGKLSIDTFSAMSILTSWSSRRKRFDKVNKISRTVVFKSKCRRWSEVWSTAICLKLVIRSAAFDKLRIRRSQAVLAFAAYASNLERRIVPVWISSTKTSVISLSELAVNKLLPIGVFNSCATPATTPPRAANFSCSTSLLCVCCRRKYDSALSNATAANAPKDRKITRSFSWNALA